MKEKPEKIGQEQIHKLLFGEQLSWQSIIYDLINTEQLDPWDIDLTLLAEKYLRKIREIEEANLFTSSKVLFAAAFLLRIKSEIILNQHLPNLDSILFGKKEEKKYAQERIDIEDEIPELIPRSPLPRFRKVTLDELMSALGKAVATENRRVKKVINKKQQEIETSVSIPKTKINLKDKIKEVYSKVKLHFNRKNERISFSKLAGKSMKEKIQTFVPLLHLDYQNKILLEQEKHLEEIWIWLKEAYNKRNKTELNKIRLEVEEFLNKEKK